MQCKTGTLPECRLASPEAFTTVRSAHVPSVGGDLKSPHTKAIQSPLQTARNNHCEARPDCKQLRVLASVCYKHYYVLCFSHVGGCKLDKLMDYAAYTRRQMSCDCTNETDDNHGCGVGQLSEQVPISCMPNLLDAPKVPVRMHSLTSGKIITTSSGGLSQTDWQPSGVHQIE